MFQVSEFRISGFRFRSQGPGLRVERSLAFLGTGRSDAPKEITTLRLPRFLEPVLGVGVEFPGQVSGNWIYVEGLKQLSRRRCGSESNGKLSTMGPNPKRTSYVDPS